MTPTAASPWSSTARSRILVPSLARLPGPPLLQLGPAVAVIAVTSATANVFTIASGPLVFGSRPRNEPLGWCCAFWPSRS